MTSRAAGRITSAISPGHEGILVLVGVCVNRIGKDLFSIWLYSANEWSPKQADKHLCEIGSICDRLLDDPELGRSRDS